MATRALTHSSERRAERLLDELLESQGWDTRRPPRGDILVQQEYRAYPEIAELLANASKSGEGFGIPEAIILERTTNTPLAVIEAKASMSEIDRALKEAQHYAASLHSDPWRPLAIGLAGTTEDEFQLRVSKLVGSDWLPITYENHPIGWIPTRANLENISVSGGPTEIRPTIPPLEVLAVRAKRINRLLREAHIKDEFRPAVVAAIMLGMWFSKGDIRREARYILRDINEACRDAFIKAGKPDLAKSLRVDEANGKLREKARVIAKILERLNVTVLTAEHDYLGHLYETFFRYTGGNTIGQYFTPRHITSMMAEICGVTKNDIVLDPTCGTGGFLIACMDRILRTHHLSRAQMVKVVKKHLIGFEEEPVTAALCVANMILRGDGSTGVQRADCFSAPDFPSGVVTVALMNPPFPHQKTDTPVENFVSCALSALRDRGKLAAILPLSLLVKATKGPWRQQILASNSLLAVCQLPDELFQPFSGAITAFVVLEKGVPHNPKRKTMFVRLNHDGLTLHKGARIERNSEPNQIPEAIDAILNGTEQPGFSGMAGIEKDAEWAVGAYIKSATPEEGEIREAVDVLVRRLASFYTRYAPEIIKQRNAISADEIHQVSYLDFVSPKKRANAKEITGAVDEIAEQFDILYGLPEIETREGIPPGRTLIISPTEQYNGCYGWLEFGTVLAPPFITVARTGSIGEAFVHLEPCAPNSDCLVLIPRVKDKLLIPRLILAASAIRLERWRYNYDRKITPSRLASVKLTHSAALLEFSADLLGRFKSVMQASLLPYKELIEDGHDIEIARKRLTELAKSPNLLVKGKALSDRLSQFQT